MKEKEQENEKTIGEEKDWQYAFFLFILSNFQSAAHSLRHINKV